MSLRNLGGAMLLLTPIVLGACSTTQRVEVVTVLNQNNCVNTTAGITETSLEKVRTLRSSRLLAPPEDAPIKPENDLPTLEATRIYVVSKGQQPTPGYGFELEQAKLQGETLTINVHWRTPPRDAVLPQMLTHPCIVVGVPDTTATTLVATDQNGEFARLDL